MELQTIGSVHGKMEEWYQADSTAIDFGNFVRRINLNVELLDSIH